VYGELERVVDELLPRHAECTSLAPFLERLAALRTKRS
jgi:hypothetical protein